MSTTVDEMQLRGLHSFLHHRTKHLSWYHNGHVKNLVQELSREHEQMHCGYLSLRHNCSTNCRNMSLMITETSTTLSRPRSTRKFVLLPLFLSPRRHGDVAGPLPPCARFGGSERHISMNSTVEFLHVRLVLRLFSLSPPLIFWRCAKWCVGHCDRHPLVTQVRAEASLSPAAGTSSAAACIVARSHHNDCPLGPHKPEQPN